MDSYATRTRKPTIQPMKPPNREDIKSTARRVVSDEAFAVKRLADNMDNQFAAAVELIPYSKGRLVVTGIGKSAIIGTKIVATLNSTGTPVEKEACPNNLAPASSTTVQLVTGDALAVCLLECRGFTQKDYAKSHPGGSLGKKLYMRVSDAFEKMRQNNITQLLILRNGTYAGIIHLHDILKEGVV